GLAQGVLQPAVVPRVNLIAAALRRAGIWIEAVMLVGELFGREDRRHAGRREQTDEGEFDTPLDIVNAIAQEEIAQPRPPETFNVVRREVVYSLRPISEPKQPAVNRLAHRLGKRRLAVR